MDLSDRLQITGRVVSSVEEAFAERAKSAGRASGVEEIGRLLAGFMMVGESWAWKLYFNHGLVATPKLTIEASATLGRESEDALRIRPLSGGYMLDGPSEERPDDE